jgi:hypothetical protein
VTYGQAQQGDFAAVPGQASYVNAAPVDATLIDPGTSLTSFVLSSPDGSDSSSIFQNPTFGRTGNPNAHSNPHFTNQGGTILGLTTATTFGGAFAGQAGPSKGKVFRYTMLGNPPAEGGTTNVPTNIDEVSWTLLNADGSVFKTVQFAPFETPMLGSPNFVDARYSSSSSPTQFADAVQRAEFYNSLSPGQPWHTRLVPSVVGHANITVPYRVSVQLSNGTVIQARSYFTGVAPDGSTFVLMLNLLFNFFFDNEFVNQINLGTFTEDAVNVVAAPNTFLYSLNTTNPNVPGGCCVLGFHTYFFDGSVPQNRLLGIFASWISPGLFGNGFQDITGLSHEISELFNDPFVDNATPNWQFPGQPPTSKVCQSNLETGDPIEVLANATTTVTLNGYTYHPQNEALLPWFGMGSSNALGGAFSYPDTTVLPHAAIPCPQ